MKGVYFDLQFDQYCQNLSSFCPSEVAAAVAGSSILSGVN